MTMDCSPTRPLCPWHSPGENTGVGCRFLLWGVFMTHGLNPLLQHLLHWQGDSLPQGHLRSPKSSVQFSSVTQSCLTLSNPMNCSTPGLPVHHQLPKSTQTHVHWFGDAIQPSHPLSSLSLPAFNLSQRRGLSQCIDSLYQVAKALEFQPQHQPFQWILRTDFL